MKKVRLIINGAETSITRLDVGAGESGRYFIELETAILETAAHFGVSLSDQAFLSFDVSKDGSCEIVCDVSEAAAPYAAGIHDAMLKNDFGDVPARAQAALRRLRDGARKYGRTVHLGLGDRTKLASIANVPEPAPVESDDFMNGQTTVYGRVLRLNAINVASGNDKGTGTFVTHAGVRIKLVNVSEEMIRTLGRHLLQRVEMHGLATWNTSSWKMTQFRPQHVQLHDRRFVDVIRDLRSVSDDLVGLDVDAVLTELRGDE